MNIGEKIDYVDGYGEASEGIILAISSDMDSYDEMELKDGVPYYASKKLTASENKRRKKAKKSPLSSPVFAPVKEKNINSVFLEVMPVKTPNGVPEYVLFKDARSLYGGKPHFWALS
jgi:hypothetical protein